MPSRRAHFIGGRANDQWDSVAEVSPGVLPEQLAARGSLYQLVEVPGRQPEYHHRPAIEEPAGSDREAEPRPYGTHSRYGGQTSRGRHRDGWARRSPAASGSGWPEGWPRIYPEMTGGPAAARSPQSVRFVGGLADGLLDRVEEINSGQLPQRVLCLGSIYDLTETAGGGWEYRVEPKP